MQLNGWQAKRGPPVTAAQASSSSSPHQTWHAGVHRGLFSARPLGLNSLCSELPAVVQYIAYLHLVCEFQTGHCCAGRILWTHRSAAVQVTAVLLLMVWAEKLCFLAGNICCHTRGSQLALQGEEGACYQPGYQSPGSTVLQTTHPCGNDTSAPKPLQRTRQNTDEASAETCELELPSSVVARL